MSNLSRRQLGRGVACVVAVVGAVALGSPAGATAGGGPTGGVVAPAAVDAALQQALRFRAGMGLSVDLAHVRALEAKPAGTVDREFGVALAPGEAAEVKLRQLVAADDAPTVRRAVRSLALSQHFAGLVMDNATGKLTLMLTDRASSTTARAVSGLLKHPQRFVVRLVPHTQRRLAAVQSAIDASRGPDIAATSVDEVSNVVVVRARGQLGELQAALDERFGAGLVRVEQGAVALAGTTLQNSPPFKGGQQVNSSTGLTCTSAFVARDGLNLYYLLTAGHCGRNGAVYDQQGVLVGNSDITDITGTDMTRIPIQANFKSNLTTISYSTYLGQGQYRAITSSQATDADVVGENECYTGINSTSLQCGALRTKTLSVDTTTGYGERLTYTNGREFDADCNPGDSGGSVLSGNQARGIVSVKLTRTLANDTCGYVHIRDALAAGGLRNVVTSP